MKLHVSVRHVKFRNLKFSSLLPNFLEVFKCTQFVEENKTGKAEAKTGHQVNVSLDKVRALGEKKKLVSRDRCAQNWSRYAVSDNRG